MICTKCHIEKEITSFHKSKKHKSGFNSICKSCESIRSKIKNELNREKRLVTAKKWRDENKEKQTDSIKLWREQNKEKTAAYYSEYRNRNRGKVNARWMERYTMKLKQTPQWLTKEQLLLINNFYVESAYLTETTGECYQVDHIVPLNSKIVSGLHVPWNLRVITAKENRVKSNKLI